MNEIEHMNLDGSLFRLSRELQAVSASPSESAIFGSTGLVMRDIINRKPDDIDVFVSRRVWGALLARDGWTVETPNAGDPPILTYAGTPCPLHLFFDWHDQAVFIDPRFVMETSEYIRWFDRWFSVASVEEIARQKRQALSWGTAKVQKHKPDLEAIEAWTQERKASHE